MVFSDAAHELLDELLESRILGGLTAEARAEFVRDVDIVKAAVLGRQEPHIALVGKPGVPIRAILRSFLDNPADTEISERIGLGRWCPYNHGAIQLLDLRRVSGDVLGLRGIDYHAADAVIGVVQSGDTEVDDLVEDLVRVVYKVEDDYGISPSAAFGIYRESPRRQAGDYLTHESIKAAFHHLGFERSWAPVVQMTSPGALVRRLTAQMPNQARMMLARMSADPRTKTEITDAFVRICASLNATIATVPLPVASTVPITSVQVIMIASIAYVSGRDLNTRTIAEFMGAMGMNVASGLALRELARTAAGLVPFAGPFFSAAIAGKATQIIGAAAQEYFIHH